MTNGNNLPKLIKYGNKIKDVSIIKLPGSMKFGSLNNAYGIKFTEIFETEKQIGKIWPFKRIEIETSEVERIIPFSFKSLEIAKDFAQYIPGMQIWGERLYENFGDTGGVDRQQMLYETYIINNPNLNINLGIKFIDECLHPMQEHLKKKQSVDGNIWHSYYVNDLDKRFFDGTQGNWYDYTELIVDCFFTAFEFQYNLQKLIPRDRFELISDRLKFENENTHKFILIENK